MKKVVIILVVLALLGGGAYLYLRYSKQAKAPVEEDASSQTQNEASGQETKAAAEDNAPAGNEASKPAPAATPSAQPQTKPVTGTFSSGEEGELSPDVLVVEIAYDGKDFNPGTIDIKVGDIVIFRNNGSVSFWPASNPHPSHTVYPEFDAGTAIPAQGKYQFQFTKAGTWGFHDHLNPSATGMVNVSK